MPRYDINSPTITVFNTDGDTNYTTSVNYVDSSGTDNLIQATVEKYFFTEEQMEEFDRKQKERDRKKLLSKSITVFWKVA